MQALSRARCVTFELAGRPIRRVVAGTRNYGVRDNLKLKLDDKAVAAMAIVAVGLHGETPRLKFAVRATSAKHDAPGWLTN